MSRGPPKGHGEGRSPLYVIWIIPRGFSPQKSINSFTINIQNIWNFDSKEFLSSFDSISWLLSHFDQWNIFSIFDCCETIQICILFNRKILLRSSLKKRNHSEEKIFWFYRHLIDRSKIEIFSSKIFEKSENFSSLFFEFWNFFFFWFFFSKFFFFSCFWSFFFVHFFKILVKSFRIESQSAFWFQILMFLTRLLFEICQIFRVWIEN